MYSSNFRIVFSKMTICLNMFLKWQYVKEMQSLIGELRCKKSHNHFYNIWRPIDGSVNIPFSTSETKLDN